MVKQVFLYTSCLESLTATYSRFAVIAKQYWCIPINWSQYFIQIPLLLKLLLLLWLLFWLVSSFCLRVSISTMCRIYLSSLLRPLLAMTISQIFIICDDLDSLKVDWPGVWCPTIEIPLRYFSWLQVWGRKTTEGECYFHHVRSRLHTINMTLITLLRHSEWFWQDQAKPWMWKPTHLSAWSTRGVQLSAILPQLVFHIHLNARIQLVGLFV